MKTWERMDNQIYVMSLHAITIKSGFSIWRYNLRLFLIETFTLKAMGNGWLGWRHEGVCARLSWPSKWQPVELCSWAICYLSCFHFFFWDEVSLCCPGCSWTHDSPALASQVAGITGMCHYTQSLFSFLRESYRNRNNQKIKPWVKRIWVGFEVDKSLLVWDFRELLVRRKCEFGVEGLSQVWVQRDMGLVCTETRLKKNLVLQVWLENC